MNTLLTSLAKHALASPQAIAVRSRDESLTYAQLMTAVKQVAQRLGDCRARSLGIYLDNGIEWIVLDLASIAADIKVVPLPWFFSDEQLSHAVETGAVDVIAYTDDLPRGVTGTGVAEELYGNCHLQPLSLPVSRATTATPGSAKLSFTSGSTGTPRGVELEHRFIDQTCRSISKAIATLDIEKTSEHFTLRDPAGKYRRGLSSADARENGIRRTCRARLVYQPNFVSTRSGCSKLLTKIQPDSLILTPQLLELFCRLVENDAIDPACLVFVAVGGARVGESLMRRARSVGIPAYEGYGLTEFGSVAILNTPQDNRIGSVGKPLPGVTVEFAADGEICLSTTLWQITANARPAKKVTVQTGDFGSIDSDGFIYVHGRKSNLIVLSSGRNVSPEWVETELNSSPLILQSYVFSDTGSELSALLVTAGSGVANSALDAEVERINLKLPAYAQIKHSHRLPYPFFA